MPLLTTIKKYYEGVLAYFQIHSSCHIFPNFASSYIHLLKRHDMNYIVWGMAIGLVPIKLDRAGICFVVLCNITAWLYKSPINAIQI